MSKDFTVKDIDLEGMETLQVIANADKFNHWMYSTIAPFCSGNILEIGSGIGNISQQFLIRNQKLTLTDLRENYCQILQKKFEKFPSLQGVRQIDIVHPQFDDVYQNLFESFDTIYALNIVEHVKDDVLALSNCKKLLKKGGNLVILVPAYQALYNQFDKELEHYRRYTQNTLDQLFTANQLQIIHRQYFNLMGIAGWWFSGSILRKKTIPEGQMNLYNLLVPIFKILDRLILRKVGLSVITVGKKA